MIGIVLRYSRLQQFGPIAICGSLQTTVPAPLHRNVRLTPRSSDAALRVILDPRRLLRWVLIGRICLASAIFIAAVSNWSSVDSSKTLVASLAFAISAIVTVGSAGYGEIYRRRFGHAFVYMQAIFDLLLVTAVVHSDEWHVVALRRALHPRHRDIVAPRPGLRRAVDRRDSASRSTSPTSSCSFARR